MKTFKQLFTIVLIIGSFGSSACGMQGVDPRKFAGDYQIAKCLGLYASFSFFDKNHGFVPDESGRYLKFIAQEPGKDIKTYLVDMHLDYKQTAKYDIDKYSSSIAKMPKYEFVNSCIRDRENKQVILRWKDTCHSDALFYVHDDGDMGIGFGLDAHQPSLSVYTMQPFKEIVKLWSYPSNILVTWLYISPDKTKLFVFKLNKPGKKETLDIYQLPEEIIKQFGKKD